MEGGWGGGGGSFVNENKLNKFSCRKKY